MNKIVASAHEAVADVFDGAVIMCGGFGDFWFEELEVGKYSLNIEAKGFAAKTIDSISTERDVNLGDIPLSK